MKTQKFVDNVNNKVDKLRAGGVDTGDIENKQGSKRADPLKSGKMSTEYPQKSVHVVRTANGCSFDVQARHVIFFGGGRKDACRGTAECDTLNNK